MDVQEYIIDKFKELSDDFTALIKEIKFVREGEYLICHIYLDVEWVEKEFSDVLTQKEIDIYAIYGQDEKMSFEYHLMKR